jgi:chromosome segregation ATPase
MARGGINKALVQDACTALRSRGQHPSIDAVRVQLGNTGSKTTIARYLKELQPAPSTALPSVRDRISTPILHIIDELTHQLQVETDLVVTQVHAEQAQERIQHDADLQRLQQMLDRQAEQMADWQTQITSAQTEQQQTLSALSDQTEQLQQVHADNHGLLIRLEEKDAQIAQLTEQHTHTRLNLEHYRDQSQALREQLIRQHEHQLQLINGELRHVQAQCNASQETLVLLNRDNEALIQQLTAKQQQAHQLDKQLRVITKHHDQLRTNLEQQHGVNQVVSNQLADAQRALQLSTLSCQHLKGELARWVQAAKANGWPAVSPETEPPKSN